jgi:hypothetical protein
MNKVSYNNHEEPIVLSKALFDLLLKQEHFSELIALYSFYYYTAKWQKTNTPRAVNTYVSQALNWSTDKISKYKRILISLGLIENIVRKNENNSQFVGNYIRVNFIWSKNSVKDLELDENPATAKIGVTGKNGKKPAAAKIGVTAKNPTNALSNNNKNALNNNNASFDLGNFDLKTKNITPKQFDKFWAIYPRKGSKGKALTEWNKICLKKERPTFRQIKNAILTQKESEQWQNPKFIPLPSTWLHQSRWLDDASELKGSWKKDTEENTFVPMFDELNYTRRNQEYD